MLLNLTDLSSESLQNQIVRQIRAYILAGNLEAESDLPSIRALAREQRVSVITVQRAYETLVRDNLIHSRRGKGFFVSKMPENAKRDMAKERLENKLESIVREALAEGLTKEDLNEAVESVLKKNAQENLQE